MAVGRTTLATREIKGNHTMTKATTKKNKPKLSKAEAAMRNIRGMGARTNSASQSFQSKRKKK